MELRFEKVELNKVKFSTKTTNPFAGIVTPRLKFSEPVSEILNSVKSIAELPLLKSYTHSLSGSIMPLAKNSLIKISALAKFTIETNSKTTRNTNDPCFTALFFNLLPQRKESDEKI